MRHHFAPQCLRVDGRDHMQRGELCFAQFSCEENQVDKIANYRLQTRVPYTGDIRQYLGQRVQHQFVNFKRISMRILGDNDAVQVKLEEMHVQRFQQIDKRILQ